MVFQNGQDDLVARLKVRPAPAGGDQIDAFGRTANEDDLFLVRRVQECPGLPARVFHGIGGDLAHVVDAAMHVRIARFIGFRYLIDDGTRLLRAGTVVEIDKWFAVHLFRQNREIGANTLDRICTVHRHQSASAIQAETALPIWSPTGPSGRSSNISAMKASISNDVA